MANKYELTDHTKVVNGHTLHQIKALKDFSNVKKDDLGGWIEDYRNLSQSGNAWIYDDAQVLDYAFVSDNASIEGHASIESDGAGEAQLQKDMSGQVFNPIRSMVAKRAFIKAKARNLADEVAR